jgi:hypothetical protein
MDEDTRAFLIQKKGEGSVATDLKPCNPARELIQPMAKGVDIRDTSGEDAQ